MSEGRNPNQGSALPPPRAPAHLAGAAGERLLAQVAFVRSEALQVMAALDTDTDTLRNLVYRLAQLNVTLSAVLAELIRVPVQDAPP